jgi:hypothetical protein
MKKYFRKQLFSIINIIKTRLQNKMEDNFLTDSLTLYIERKIVVTFNVENLNLMTMENIKEFEKEGENGG